jgi:hypothetical protein
MAARPISKRGRIYDEGRAKKSGRWKKKGDQIGELKGWEDMDM